MGKLGVLGEIGKENGITEGISFMKKIGNVR